MTRLDWFDSDLGLLIFAADSLTGWDVQRNAILFTTTEYYMVVFSVDQGTINTPVVLQTVHTPKRVLKWNSPSEDGILTRIRLDDAAPIDNGLIKFRTGCAVIMPVFTGVYHIPVF
jgi:hypothetical protein